LSDVTGRGCFGCVVDRGRNGSVSLFDVDSGRRRREGIYVVSGRWKVVCRRREWVIGVIWIREM
jgi:hypothetical protein